MPKLNTTIDNIELKSNKVFGAVPSADWTDTQYPTAKTLFNTYTSLIDIAHPIGSLLTTSTNENPAATIGGTWELVDKAFKDTYISLDSTFWTATNATIGEHSNVLLADHSISVRLNLTSTGELNDNPTDIGKLALTQCGITELTHAILYAPIISDLGNCVMNYKATQDGIISVHEVINIDDTHTMPAGSDFYINFVQPVSHNKMIDSFCDKFYWKRTA